MQISRIVSYFGKEEESEMINYEVSDINLILFAMKGLCMIDWGTFRAYYIIILLTLNNMDLAKVNLKLQLQQISQKF